MPKLTLYGEEARKKLKEGVDEVAKAVSTTLGPKGRNVALERPWGVPNVVHDGVTVAREIEPKDPFANLGAQMIKESASKTNDIAGDGTTTSMILAQAIVEEGLKNVTSGANPMFIKKGIEKAVEFCNKELERISVKIQDPSQVEQVATISAADETIGKLVASAIEKVGKDGVLTTEEGNTAETTVEFKDGMEFKAGIVSPYFVNNPTRMEAVIKDAIILITDKKLSSPNEMIPFLESVVKMNKNIAIICGDIEGAALSLMIANKMKGILNAIVVKAPYGKEKRQDFLEDLAALTGGRVLTDDEGVHLETLQADDLGHAKTIISNKNETIVVADKNETTKARITQLQGEVANEKNALLIERLEERIARLLGGVAVIEVGASTEVEMKEKVERVKDAMGATKAAIDEGVVAGGGVALTKVAKSLKAEIIDNFTGDDEEKIGLKIVEKALIKPLWFVASNAGEKADAIVDRVIKAEQDNLGYNVFNSKFEDMFKAGVIDPVKVTRNALINAASVAMMVLTTEALVVEDKEDKKEEK